ncbi:MAG: purine-cytosine permease family protein [Planctomycetota bacterium]|jgi:NCS1 family nucleobase:cation symporter-1
MGETKHSGIIERLDKLNEFERHPVTQDRLQSGRHFAGVFAGEHVAGTEFVIGALFVSKGAHTYDVIVGLILGNLLAVLSWVLICAPIAVRTRLTLYWYLRKIAGPVVMIIYNILNAIMYCILAGAMITVAASAVRIPFGIPDQVGWFPTDMRFVLVVLAVGAVVVTLAIWGFKKLAQFSEVCSPWMFLMFIAGALALLPTVVAEMPEVGAINSFSDFWKVADTKIWPGPQPGQEDTLGFLHIVFFAWICNLAMHVGLSDMALFRYARRASYGFFSAFGMYLGHYLAWICAGIMGAGAALILKTPLTELDSGSVACTALGAMGAVAVVIAGWTTSNPTIYRAGLALQAVTPNWPRWFVTLIAGTVTTIVACSPFVFTKLLGFVGIYGLLLMPVGAIVFVEHWIFPRIGLTQYWVSRRGLIMSWPALISWGAALLAALILWKNGPLPNLLMWIGPDSLAQAVGRLGMLHLFFLVIPSWLITAVLYIVLSYASGAARESAKASDQETPAPAAEVITPSADDQGQHLGRRGLSSVSGIAALGSLVFCLGASIWVTVADRQAYPHRLGHFKTAIVYATVIYFVTSLIWIWLKEERDRP